jgi:ethanolamine utilization protein EutN
MYVAKVIGNVVATQKSAGLTGMKLLFIQPYTNRDGVLAEAGNSMVAVDTVGAGTGDCVLFTHGSSARATPDTKSAPVDAVIVAIVDSIDVCGRAVEKP